jgi:hypothetical protein
VPPQPVWKPTPPPKTEAKAATQADKDAEAWKDKYFAKHPDADANKDGTLSWPEYKAYRAEFDPAKPAQGNSSSR